MSDLSLSALTTYRDCPLRYNYQRQLGLTLRGGVASHDLRYGSAGHVALAQLYSGASLKAVGEAFMSTYPQDQYPEPLPRNSQGKTQTGFLSALWRYINDVWRQDCEQWEVLTVELPETSEGLGEYDHMLILDLVVRDKQDGMVWGVDHKITGSYLDDRFWGRYSLSSQVRMYVDQIKRQYGNCGGFIINAISLRNRSKAYTPRTGPDKGKQLPAGDWFAFGRMVYRPDEACLRLERANIAATADDIQRSIESDTWSYNTERCHAGTEYACPYVTICQPGWSWPQDEEQIKEYYRQRCGRRIVAAGVAIEHCELEPGHDGECDPTPPEDDAAPTIIVTPEDDPYYSSVED